MPEDGYAWWYLDGISDDGHRAVTVIAFIGSVFSPWYRWSGRRVPQNHVCLNVATYGPGGRFAMTERGRAALRQSPAEIAIGPSRMTWNDGRLVVDFDEVTLLPRPGRLRGRIVLTPAAVTGVEMALTPDGAHRWRPFAPVARIEVEIDRPGWDWAGHGYLDANFGTRALEADFDTWQWGRFPVSGGCACFYDARRRDGTALGSALMFGQDGQAAPLPPPQVARFRQSSWGVRRETRADPGYRPRQVAPMLDAPFYCRSAIRTQIGGTESVGVHEALDLRRFRSPWLMPMLVLRVPRRAGWNGVRSRPAAGWRPPRD